jgi:hypothetical protein
MEELKRLLAGTRSDHLRLGQVPELDLIPGLRADLDTFVGAATTVHLCEFLPGEQYDMKAYWRAIAGVVDTNGVLFSALPTILRDERVDRIWRFRTLVHMWHEREVQLTQYGNDLLVEAL